jgi:hypothetical protein
MNIYLVVFMFVSRPPLYYSLFLFILNLNFTLGYMTANHNRGWRAAFSQSMAKDVSCHLTVVPDISVLNGSVQCSVVMFYCLANVNKRSEECCKVNLATLVSSAVYHITWLEPRSSHIQPARGIFVTERAGTPFRKFFLRRTQAGTVSQYSLVMSFRKVSLISETTKNL